MTTATKQRTRSLLLAILSTGILVGLFDGLAAILQYTINGGTKPASVFKYIASAVYGKKAFTGGTPMVIWGVFFHLLIALLFTAFFYLLVPRIAWLRQNTLLAGILYGLFIWLVMSQVVIRLSALPAPVFQLKQAVIAALILVVCIGIPVSYLSNKYYRLQGMRVKRG